MATTLSTTPLRATSRQITTTPFRCLYHTSRSQSSPINLPVYPGGQAESGFEGQPDNQVSKLPSPLARLPTRSILRSLFLSTFISTPILYKPGFAIFQAIANSKSSLLNPDKNVLLRALLRPTFYDHFCAGRDEKEIGKTSTECRDQGCSGVILSYSKEVQVSADKGFLGYDESKADAMEAEIRHWRDGNLETLDMVKDGDWLAIKLSGAGLSMMNVMMNNEEPPKMFVDAMHAIVDRAGELNCKLWIDSEQSAIQPAIDRWTRDLQRKYNRDGRCLVYNTIQAYLKESRSKVQNQLQTAADEGWTMGIKLVRGAYMSNDKREIIHNTKAETDQSYDSIVEDLLRGRFPALANNPDLKFEFMIAGHNTESIRKAYTLASELMSTGELRVYPAFAQLQGMADEVACELLQACEQAKKTAATSTRPSFAPNVYKYLTWGTVQECMQYLARRLVENRGAADRMKEGTDLLKKELWRRIFNRA